MLSVDLKPHQYKAVQNMKNGCILCGGTGSGKSRTSLAYYCTEQVGAELYDEPVGECKCGIILNEFYPKQDLFIITTARKRDTKDWESEMAPFLMSPDKDVCFWDINITIDSWQNISKYEDVTGAFFIFDEQKVSGKGKWVKKFLKIVKMNDWILLSATPGDTWLDYIPVFIANGFFKNRTQFNSEHVLFKPFSNYPQVVGYLGTRRLERLRDKILIDMDFQRQTVQHHEYVEVEYDIALYKKMVKYQWDEEKDKPIENASEFCYALRKIVNSDYSRVSALLDIMSVHNRVIVFYNFDYELEVLRGVAEKYGIEYREWNGHNHQDLPNGTKWMYLVQYNAGAEGWNCVITDTIVFYSQNYSYKTLIQSCGRIDRLNTPYVDLYYYHLFSRAPIDLAIRRALKNKKKFNEGRFYAK